jgi:hypothetical protein
VLDWAAGHGLDPDDPGVYLLVTTEDEAATIDGEVAFLKGTVSYAVDRAIRAALAAARSERDGDPGDDPAEPDEIREAFAGLRRLEDRRDAVRGLAAGLRQDQEDT